MAFQKWLKESDKITITPTGITAQKVALVGFHTWQADLASVGVAIGALYPGLPAARCRNIDLEPYGQTKGGGKEYRKATIDYSTAEAAQRQEVGHIDQRIEFSVDCLVRNGGNWDNAEETGDYSAAGGAGGEGEEAGTTVREDDLAILPVSLEVYSFTLTVADMEAYRSRIRRVSGCVNSDNFAKAKPESLRFEGASSESFVDQQGNEKWRVTVHIAYSGDDHTWNQKWNKDDEKWEKIEFKNEPKTLYKKVPFVGLDQAT